MEKGVTPNWTPGLEIEYEERIKKCRSFAERHLTMLLRDVLKYDGRTKESKRAMAQARLRFSTASDKDLEELAELEARMQMETPTEPVSVQYLKGEIPGLHKAILVAGRLRELKKERDQIRGKGVSKEELECQ